MAGDSLRRRPVLDRAPDPKDVVSAAPCEQVGQVPPGQVRTVRR